MPEIIGRTETEVELSISVYCARCGAGLCGNVNVRRDGTTIDMDPCEDCLDDMYETGKREGYDKGIGDCPET